MSSPACPNIGEWYLWFEGRKVEAIHEYMRGNHCQNDGTFFERYMEAETMFEIFLNDHIIVIVNGRKTKRRDSPTPYGWYRTTKCQELLKSLEKKFLF